MPPVVVAVAGAAASAIGGATFLGLTGFAAFGAKAALGLVLSVAASSLSPKPKSASVDVGAQVSGREDSIRQAMPPRRSIIGEVKVGGFFAYLEGHGGNNNETLSIVTLFADHEIAGFEEFFFGDDALTVDGTAIKGAYDGYADVYTKLGTADQTAHAELVAISDGLWTADHRWRGVANAYFKLKYNEQRFGEFRPEGIQGRLRGRLFFDTRDSVTRFSRNPALALRDYLVNKVKIASLRIPDSFVSAAASVCDERVRLASAAQGFTANLTTARLELTAALGNLRRGTGVRLSTTGTLPSGLSPDTTYYWVPRSAMTGALASSYNDALQGATTGFLDAGTGDHTVTLWDEPRYTADGTYDDTTDPAEVVMGLLASMAGMLVWTGRVFEIHAGAAVTPEVDFDEDDLRAPVTVRTQLSQREIFNAVRAVYVDPDQDWQPAPAPEVSNSTYLSQSGGVAIVKTMQTPWTVSPATAQRLAKIELERAWQPLSVSWPANMKGLQVSAGRTARFTHDRFGWADKHFRVLGRTFQSDGGVDLSLREEAAAMWDWSQEETAVDPAPNTNLPRYSTVAAPGAPAVAEELYVTRDGSGVKVKANLSWAAADDAFVGLYRVEYRLASASVWIVLPAAQSTAREIADIAPGVWDFRVIAINALGFESLPATTRTEIYGLSAPPVAIVGLSIAQAGGLAILRWNRHGDLDVRVGGRIEFRHADAPVGATATESVSIGDSVDGGDTLAVMPLKPGTYFARAVDSGGIPGPWASVVTNGAQVLAFAPVDLLTEDPDFLGDKTNVTVVGGVLRLAGDTPIDDWPDFDAVTDVDTGSGGISATGSYRFSTGMALPSKMRVRLRTELTALTVNTLDLIDDRAAMIDSWEDFDGTGAAAGDCQIWVRETDDDPNGSPVTFGTWNRLHSGEYDAHGFEFEARLSTADPAFNILVSALAVRATEVA